MLRIPKKLLSLLIPLSFSLFLSGYIPADPHQMGPRGAPGDPVSGGSEEGSPSSHAIFLPLLYKPPKQVLRVNAPYFPGDIQFDETAIFWFGRVNPSDNYADVRVGYNDEILFVHVAAFDRLLWYDTSPTPDSLTEWDAVSLHLNLEGDSGLVPEPSSYRFVGQLSWSSGDAWRAGYRGDGSAWVADPVAFTAESGWRGEGLNDYANDRGWRLTFRIPFNSLGQAGPPASGDVWGMAVVLHDRDDEAGTPIPDKFWPPSMDDNRPETWGQLAFGLPSYAAPEAAPAGSVTVRQGLNGALVQDGAVGGHTVCGSGTGSWAGWGETNYAGYKGFNIQNQYDVADWPCFSKYYVTFPLEAIPPGKVILSASLTLYEFGNAGQGYEPAPKPSLIQAMLISGGWDESTLTWNNAPPAAENVSRTWVDPIYECPETSCRVPWTWDVSLAVARAHAFGGPLRLVMYSADSAYNSGKYFVSSDTGDWDEIHRPTLQITYGDPPD